MSELKVMKVVKGQRGCGRRQGKEGYVQVHQLGSLGTEVIFRKRAFVAAFLSEKVDRKERQRLLVPPDTLRFTVSPEKRLTLLPDCKIPLGFSGRKHTSAPTIIFQEISHAKLASLVAEGRLDVDGFGGKKGTRPIAMSVMEGFATRMWNAIWRRLYPLLDQEVLRLLRRCTWTADVDLYNRLIDNPQLRRCVEEEPTAAYFNLHDQREDRRQKTDFEELLLTHYGTRELLTANSSLLGAEDTQAISHRKVRSNGWEKTLPGEGRSRYSSAYQDWAQRVRPYAVYGVYPYTLSMLERMGPVRPDYFYRFRKAQEFRLFHLALERDVCHDGGFNSADGSNLGGWEEMKQHSSWQFFTKFVQRNPAASWKAFEAAKNQLRRRHPELRRAASFGSAWIDAERDIAELIFKQLRQVGQVLSEDNLRSMHLGDLIEASRCKDADWWNQRVERKKPLRKRQELAGETAA